MIPCRVLLLLLICLVAQQSDASFLEFVRKLGQADNSKTKLAQISPSPTPVPGPVDPPEKAKAAQERCDVVSYHCHDDINNMSACLPPAADGSQGSILLVHNDGESYLKFRITLRPVNYTYDNVEIPIHQVKKINISSNIEGCSSISLKASNGGCVIYIGALAPLEKFYEGYGTPVNAAYILFGTIVIIGGTLACCRLKKTRRHLDGVPYQELEMEQQQQQTLPYVNVESAGNWDQGWDDDWDEEKAVSSPGGSRLRSRPANDVSSSPADTNGWGSDWDD